MKWQNVPFKSNLYNVMLIILMCMHLSSLTSALRNTQHVPLKPSTHSTALPWITPPPLPRPAVLCFPFGLPCLNLSPVQIEVLTSY